MHTCTYTYTHAYSYIYTCPHTYTHTHIYTHTYKMYICTHASTPGTTVRLREMPDLTHRSSVRLLLVRTAIRRGVTRRSEQLNCPIHEERRVSAEQPQPTASHRTVTTARRPDRICLSALVRSQSTQFMARPSCQLDRGPPKRGHFSAILARV